MCFENRDAACAEACRARDELRKTLNIRETELQMARGERDAVTKRMVELEQENAKLKAERDAIEQALGSCEGRCDHCEHDRPDCTGECDGCSPNCECYFCKGLASNFVWKGLKKR